MRAGSEVGASAVGSRAGRVVFLLGGVLLLGAAGAAAGQWTATPWGESAAFRVLDAVGAALFAVALLVFAWGARGAGSVVSGRPVGGAALSLFGLLGLSWTLGMLAISAPGEGGTVGAVAMLLVLLSYAAPFAGVVAVVAIARAGAVPGLWRWLPSVVLAVGLIVYVYAYTDGIAVGADFGSWGVIVVYLAASRLVLGTTAIGLALYARSVRVSPPAA